VIFMPRKLQSATISFGLVTIPTDLYTATSSENISFHQIHGVCGSRIKQQLFCPVCQRVVERNELVKGYEISKGQHVQVTEEELEKLEAATSQSIDILQFVPLQTVDPIYFEKTYYLGAGKGADKAYTLLAQVMEKAQRVALAKMVMRGKENLVLLRAARGGLMLHTMYYADEVRDFNEIPKGQATTTEAELKLASRLVDDLSEATFQPELFRDEYRERLMEVIQHKAEGKDVTVQPEEQPAQVVDLMDALKASLERGPKQLRRRGAKAVRIEATPKKTAARR
jgi:DNA end-binding protein Ku